MKEWLNYFYGKADFKVVLKGKEYTKADFEYITRGFEKRVYKLKGHDLCIISPNRPWTHKDWTNRINAEKAALDHIISLGLKAQSYEIAPLEIRSADGKVHCINILLAKNFKDLAEQESLIIYDHKSDNNKVIGVKPIFDTSIERFKNPDYVKKLLAKIIDELVIAISFNLPISILKPSIDDSQHFCFELPQDDTQAPTVRYMFWDVLSDFQEFSLPLIPTLKNLKSKEYNYNPLKSLVDSIIDAIVAVMRATPSSTPPKFQLKSKKTGAPIVQTVVDSSEFIPPVKQELLKYLEQDEVLTAALDNAKKVAYQYMTKLLNTTPGVTEYIQTDVQTFVDMTRTAISIGNLDFFKIIFSAHEKNPALLTRETIEEITKTAMQYAAESPDQNEIADYIVTAIKACQDTQNEIFEDITHTAAEPAAPNKLAVDTSIKATHETQLETLKNSFIANYKKRLAQDNLKYCGLYSFFSRSYVKENDMSIKDLINHAQGKFKVGSGERSKAVMKSMGILNEKNEVADEYRWCVV